MRKLSTLVAAAVLALGASVASADPPVGDTENPKPAKTVRPGDEPTAPTPNVKPQDPRPQDTRPSDMKPAVPGDAGKVGISYPSRTNQINKHIGFVDLYLSEAANSLKALSMLADGEPGRMDAQLIAEARRNLDAALDRALAHMKHVRDYKSDLALVAPGIDTKADPATGSATARPMGNRLVKLDELESHIREAKNASRKLAAVKVDALSPTVDGVSTHLMAAQQSFRDIAKWTSYTLLDDTSLGTMPVRGETGVPAGEIDRDVGKPMGSPVTPEATTPGAPGSIERTGTPGSMTPPGTAPPSPIDRATPVDRNRTQPPTPAPKPEPVKPAPGGGY